jgi:hypothetical protein
VQEARALEVLAGLPGSVEQHYKFIAENLSDTASAARAKMVSEADMTAGKANARMSQLVMDITEQMVADIDALSCISRWVTLSIPTIEDGNNFGVDIQMQIAKHINDANAVLQTNRDKLSDYCKDRAAVLEKVVPKVTKKADSSKSTSSKSGGAVKKEDEGETVTTSSSESQDTSSGDVLPDSAEHVVQTDLKWFFKLKDISTLMMDTLLTIVDTVDKNKDKITNPRGGAGDGGRGFTRGSEYA